MKRYGREVGLIFLYFLIPALSAVTPLIAIPAITQQYGADGWTSVAIAMSIGSATAIVAELGWGVVGPQLVAGADDRERADIFRRSLASKLVAASIAIPFVVVATGLLATTESAAAIVAAIGFLLTCLSPSWYLIGVSRPGLILLAESVPKVLLITISAALILTGSPLIVYSIAIVISPILTLLISARVLGVRLARPRELFSGVRATLRAQMHLTWGRGVSALYTALPTTLVALVSPDSVATFAAADRLMRMGALVLAGIPNRLQSWIGSANGPDRIRRSYKSLAMNAALGIVASLSFWLLAPLVSRLVFSGTVTLSSELSLVAGLVLLSICISRGFGLAVVAAGRANWISLSVLLSAAIGVPSILLLAAGFGDVGALWGELIAEGTGIMAQLGILIFFARRARRQG